MIFFLRDKNNKSIFECTLSKTDLRCYVYLKEYSYFLLNNLDKQEEIIADFHELDELRGWFHENQIYKTLNPQSVIRNILKMYADKYGLGIVTD
jgi:hypothetical protein